MQGANKNSIKVVSDQEKIGNPWSRSIKQFNLSLYFFHVFTFSSCTDDDDTYTHVIRNSDDVSTIDAIL